LTHVKNAVQHAKIRWDFTLVGLIVVIFCAKNVSKATKVIKNEKL